MHLDISHDCNCHQMWKHQRGTHAWSSNE